MTCTLSQFKSGLTNYLDREIIDKIGGIRKWGVALMIVPIMAELESMVEKNKTTLQKVGYLTSDGMVDVDALYTNLKEIARKGPVTENIPTIGDVRFTEEDVDKLYRYIK